MINASVLNRDGYPVANLRAENFRVFDEKKEMEITAVVTAIGVLLTLASAGLSLAWSTGGGLKRA